MGGGVLVARQEYLVGRWVRSPRLVGETWIPDEVVPPLPLPYIPLQARVLRLTCHPQSEPKLPLPDHFMKQPRCLC